MIQTAIGVVQVQDEARVYIKMLDAYVYTKNSWTIFQQCCRRYICEIVYSYTCNLETIRGSPNMEQQSSVFSESVPTVAATRS